MKLIYLKWKQVKSFLASMDEPVSREFQIIIRTVWQSQDWMRNRNNPGRWVYEIEIPVELIT